MPKVTLTPVTSSQVHAIGYDPATRTMAVQFNRKGAPSDVVYTYPDVDPGFFARFQAAESKGKFVTEHVRPIANFTKVTLEDFNSDEAAAQA